MLPRCCSHPSRTLPVALILAAAALLPGMARPGPAAAEDDEVAKLVARLADDDFARRREAGKRLETIGEAALPRLRRAVRSHADPDVRLRAAVLARDIEKRLWGEVRCYKGNKGWVYRVALSGDGRRALSCGDALRLWDVDTGKVIRSFGEGQWGFGLSMSRDGRLGLCSAPDNSVRLWDLENGKELKRLTGHTGQVWVAALLPDGKQALTGGLDRTLRVWDLESGKELRKFEGVRDNPRCLALSPDGKYAAAGHFLNDNSPSTVRLWDIKKGQEVRAYEGHTGAISGVAFTPDGKQLVTGSFDKTLRLWDVETGKELRRFEGHPGPVDGMAVTPDGRRALSCGWDNDHDLRLWDLATGKELHRYEGHTAGLLGVVVTPDSRRALSCSKDGTLRLWNLPK